MREIELYRSGPTRSVPDSLSCGIIECGPKCVSDIQRTTYDSARSSFDQPIAIQKDKDGTKIFCDIDSPPSPITYEDLLAHHPFMVDEQKTESSLDIFLRVRGLESYALKLKQLGAKTVKDLNYLDETNIEEIGISKRDLMIKFEN